MARKDKPDSSTDLPAESLQGGPAVLDMGDAVSIAATATAPLVPAPTVTPALIDAPQGIAETVRVRLVEPGVVSVGPYAAGQDYDVDPATAQRLFGRGFIEVKKES
jgi:hypothetical protein